METVYISTLLVIQWILTHEYILYCDINKNVDVFKINIIHNHFELL